MIVNEIHPSLLKKKIIHIDMDCFFAAVEMRDNPSLRSRPVVVGGNPRGRGVVSTCSYEARKFGIHSAMSCHRAYMLCPQVIFVRPSFNKYRDISIQIRSILKRYTDLVEPVSLDEAYLDVSQCDSYAMDVAQAIKTEISKETGLTGSAGVAPNKLIAKIASDIKKPDGLTVIHPSKVIQFMEYLPLIKISGIGPATERRLKQHGLNLCKDIWGQSFQNMEAQFGSRFSRWLYDRSRGIDERDIETTRVRKSIGTETTFPKDILEYDLLKREVKSIVCSLCTSLQSRKIAGRTLTIKIKYSNFEQVTRSMSITSFCNSPEEILPLTYLLLQKTEAGSRYIRLVGLSVSKLFQLGKSIFD